MTVVCEWNFGQSLCRLGANKVIEHFRHGLVSVSIHSDFLGYILDLMPFAKICV